MMRKLLKHLLLKLKKEISLQLAAARDAEMDKRRRYAGLATPFVMEALGRPGTCARGIIGQYAKEDESGSSADAAAAWQSLSAIVQADSARTEMRACGWSPADWADAALESLRCLDRYVACW